MAVITLPANLRVAGFTLGLQRKDVSYTSAFGSQSMVVSAPVWAATLSVDTQRDDQAGDWQALLLKLRGQTNQLLVHNVGRPVPQGTIRGALQLTTEHGAGSSRFYAYAGSPQAFATIKAGDFFGIGSGLSQQLVMATENAAADADGYINFAFEPPLRTSFSFLTTLVWDRPAVLFRATQKDFSWQRQSVFVSGMSLDLIEDPRP